MTPLRLMIGHEPDAHWQRLARFYQDFARDEGSIATLSANAIQAAVKRQNPGYRLAAIADHGFIAWSDHPNHPVDILDIFIKRTARGQGFARHAIAALVQQYMADRAIKLLSLTQIRPHNACIPPSVFKNCPRDCCFHHQAI